MRVLFVFVEDAISVGRNSFKL